jgi:hypothetical protein
MATKVYKSRIIFYGRMQEEADSLDDFIPLTIIIAVGLPSFLLAWGFHLGILAGVPIIAYGVYGLYSSRIRNWALILPIGSILRLFFVKYRMDNSKSWPADPWGPILTGSNARFQAVQYIVFGLLFGLIIQVFHIF